LSVQLTSSYDLAIIYNMPVITRSQSKASSVTPIELSVPSSTLIRLFGGNSNNTTEPSSNVFLQSASTGDPYSLNFAELLDS
jgi:hypothetical protein